MMWLTSLWSQLRPEDPRRIRQFRECLAELSWDEGHVRESLTALFHAVDDLAEAEVRYYYRRRGTRAWVSGAARMAAWSLGTLGLLLPLLAGAPASVFQSWGPYGYAFLAAAASCLAANSLFGGTDGHIRFVATQLELEKLITASRVQWCRFLATTPQRGPELQQGFELILGYASALHNSTLAETDRWGQALLTELAKYQNTIDSAGRSQGKTEG